MSLLSRTTHCFSCPSGTLVRDAGPIASRNWEINVTKPSNYDSLKPFQKRLLKVEAESAIQGFAVDRCSSCNAVKYTDLSSGTVHYNRGNNS